MRQDIHKPVKLIDKIADIGVTFFHLVKAV